MNATQSKLSLANRVDAMATAYLSVNELLDTVPSPLRAKVLIARSALDYAFEALADALDEQVG